MGSRPPEAPTGSPEGSVAGATWRRHSARCPPDQQCSPIADPQMAVYTEVSDEALAAFLADYDIGSVVAFRGIAEGVENSNFSLRTTGGDFILTLYQKRVDPAELPWFLGLMEHLATRGITCPLPVRARDAAALRTLAGRHAAITTFLPGVWPRRVRPEHCGPVGAALASNSPRRTGLRADAPQRAGPRRLAPAVRARPSARRRGRARAGCRIGRCVVGDPAGVARRSAGRAHPRRFVP